MNTTINTIKSIHASIIESDKDNQLILARIKTNDFTCEEEDISLAINENVSIIAHFNKKTIFEENYTKSENVLLCCSIHREDNFFVKVVLSENTYKTFFSHLDKKADTIDWFFHLSDEERGSIFNRITSSEKHEKTKLIQRNSNDEHLEKLYHILQKTYKEDQQAVIQGYFKDLRSKISSDDKAKIFRKLNLILNTTTSVADKSPMLERPSEVEKKIRKSFFGQDEAVKQICEMISALSYGKSAGDTLCFLGPSGTGKTQLTKAIAHILCRAFVEIDCDTLSEKSDISGTDSSFHCAKESELFAKISNTNNKNGRVIALHEIDKASPNLVSVIAPILSERRLYDTFVGTYIDLKHDIIICDINSLKKLPNHVRDRLNIVNFHAYSMAEKKEIAKRHTIPDLIEEYSCNDYIEFKDSAINHLIRFSADCGMRKTEQHIKTIFSHILASWRENGEKKKKVVVTSAFVDSVLKEKVDTSSPDYIFQLHFSDYSDETKKRIEEILSILSDDYFSDETERSLLEQELKILVKLHKCSAPDFNAEIFRLDTKNLLGLDEIKMKITEKYIFEDIAKTSKPVCFLGHNGVGKTSVAKCIANAFGRNLIRIECGSITDKHTIIGTPKSYKSAGPGKLMESITCTNDIIVFDEIDKLGADSSSHDYLGDSLITLFDTGSFFDEFLQRTVALSKCKFICTCNDINKISPTLKDRMEIITFPGYNATEKKEIFSDSIIPSWEKKLNLTIEITDETTKSFIKNYLFLPGIRELEVATEKLIRRAIATKDAKAKTIEITKQLIFDVFGPSVKLSPVPEKWAPGMAMGLAVTNFGQGVPTIIESVAVDNSHFEYKLTGNCGDDVKESVELALTKIMQQQSMAFNNKLLHINLTGSEKKSGNSAGICLWASLMSLLHDRSIEGYAFTGALTLNGIAAIGGIEPKIRVAIEVNNCHTVFIPKANFLDLSEKFKDEIHDKIRVVPVSCVEEIEKIIFKSIQ